MRNDGANSAFFNVDIESVQRVFSCGSQLISIASPCGRHLIGYFLPHEGTNDIAWAPIAFETLAAYETYRTRLRSDSKALENFALAQSKRIILREERNFVRVVKGTFALPAQQE